MITVKTRHHVVRIVATGEPIAGLDDGTVLYGLAECGSCGVVHAFTCDHPPHGDLSDADLVDHLHHHINGVVAAFDEDVCVPDAVSDEIFDWRELAGGAAPEMS